jgi:hypothetical protein
MLKIVMACMLPIVLMACGTSGKVDSNATAVTCNACAPDASPGDTCGGHDLGTCVVRLSDDRDAGGVMECIYDCEDPAVQALAKHCNIICK